MVNIEALDVEKGMVELMCVTKEVRAHNGVTVYFHPHVITPEEIELQEKIDKFKCDERRQKRRRVKRNMYLSRRAVIMAVHTLLI